MFVLHSQLEKGCIELGELKLCKVLLINDKQFPWFILVPQRSDITEVYQMTDSDQVQLLHESSFLAENLVKIYNADKLNIAAIGNIVPQLHIHHIVRYKNDPVWPAPVWGKLEPLPYSQLEIEKIKSQFTELISKF